MDIGFSFVDLAPGGAQQLMVQLAQEIAGQGHQVKFYIYAPLNDTDHVDPYLLNTLSESASQSSNPWTLRSCQVVQMDGYHNLRRKIPYLTVYKKWVETFHSLYSVKRSGPFYAPHRIAVSKYIQSLTPKTTRFIPNGIRLPGFNKTDAKDFDIAILGRIHPAKRQDFFLRICQELHSRQQELSGLLIGGFSRDSAYKEKILKQISTLRDQGIRLHITGFLPNEQVFHWLARTKILIVPSLDEGFGRMAIEAMACGIPVISNPVGGLLEIIEHEIDGYFAELNQIKSFVALTDHLLNNPTLCEEMGMNGKVKVQSCFLIDKIASSYLDLYQQIAARSK